MSRAPWGKHLAFPSNCMASFPITRDPKWRLCAFRGSLKLKLGAMWLLGHIPHSLSFIAYRITGPHSAKCFSIIRRASKDWGTAQLEEAAEADSSDPAGALRQLLDWGPDSWWTLTWGYSSGLVCQLEFNGTFSSSKPGIQGALEVISCNSSKHLTEFKILFSFKRAFLF